MKNASIHADRPAIKPFWPAAAAGIALGLALLLTFLVTSHGLGASGAATDVIAGTGLAVAPAATQPRSTSTTLPSTSLSGATTL